MARRTAILLALVAVGACSQGRKLAETESRSACTRCHGGQDNDTGAPPGSMRGGTATSDPAVGAHSAHVQAGNVAGAFPCTACHPDPRSGSTAHGNGQIDVVFGGVAAPSLPGATPSYDPETGTCSSVHCHGAFNGGNAGNAPRWTDVGSGAGGCGSCHGVPPPSPHPVVSDFSRCRICHPSSIDATGQVLGTSAGGKHLDGAIDADGHDARWMDPQSDGFHAYAANANLLSCGECHGAELDGGRVEVGCGECHDAGLPAGVASWRVNCVMCHGGTDNGTGAPPRTIRGQGADAVRVGAHTAHVSTALAPAIGCEVCHPKPADALTPGHADGTRADVAFSGVAVQGLAAPPAWDPASPTCTTYCHGATLSGGSNPTPDWTGGSSEATCGVCHGLPPPAPHPLVTGGPGTCAGCHEETVDGTGAIIPPASGGKHLDGAVQIVGGHGESWMDPSSTAFHAYSANQGLGACQACHGPRLNALAGGNCATCHGAEWSTRCTMCHGGEAGDTAGAPPKATYGNGADAVRIGAHRAHVGGSARSFACAECHVTPADAFSSGHVGGGTASVTFGALAQQGVTTQPAWDRATRTCSSTYCHGATLDGGANRTPDWTGGSSEASCGACHAAPPPAPHPQTTACAGCHGAGYTKDAVTAATHVDGKLDLLPMTCTSCHGDAGRQGSASAAPPVDTRGNVDPAVPGVGAHLAHLQDGPLRTAMACTDCHAVPTSVTHPDAVTSFSWSALATGAGATSPGYAGGSCSATYCHGSTLGAGGTNHAPAWTGGAAEVACGSCHGAPPPLPHPQNTNCRGCHGEGYGATSVNAATHVNGTLDLGDMGCTSCHGDATKTATPEAPLNAAPPTDTSGRTSSDKVGAHQAHLRAGERGRSAPIACTGCHAVPTSLGHTDGVTQLTFGARARTGGANPAWNVSTQTCASTYCHGNYSGTYTYTYWDWGSDSAVEVTVPYAGARATPSWPATGSTCNACHGNPPQNYDWHKGHGGGTSCNLCHPHVNAAGTGFTDPAKHVDGIVDVQPDWGSSCYGCH